MVLRKQAYVLLLALGVVPQAHTDPPTVCRFRVSARVRSVYAVMPQATPGEIVLELIQPLDYATRFEAQTRAYEIAERGYMHRTVPPPEAMSFYPTDALFPPSTVVRVSVVPYALDGDPGQCFGL